jgi:hypothetical protein
MNNDPNRQQWEQQQPPPQQPPTQYEQQQWSQPQPQAWEQQPPPAYNQPQWNQPPPNQYAPQQYTPGQYNQYSNVPPYAQPQVQAQQADNFLMRFLMMGIAIRIVLLVIVPLLLCGGCAMVVFFASLAHP